MPKLKIVVACEKVIFDQAGPVSIISIFQSMNVQVTDAPLPQQAVSPNSWSIFTLWEIDPEEIDRRFTQKLEFRAPDGTLFSEHEGIFYTRPEMGTQVKINAQMTSIPIWSEGTATIRVWLKEDETEQQTYQFQIKHLRAVDESDTSSPDVDLVASGDELSPAEL